MSWFKRETKEADETKETNETKEKNDFKDDFRARYKVENSDNHIEKNAMEAYKRRMEGKKSDADDTGENPVRERERRREPEDDER